MKHRCEALADAATVSSRLSRQMMAATDPPCHIRKLLNEALGEAHVSALLEVRISLRRERSPVEQLQCNLLFRWFARRALGDMLWNASVTSKNPDRLILLDPVTDLFSATVEEAEKKRLLFGGHIGVGGVGQPQEHRSQKGDPDLRLYLATRRPLCRAIGGLILQASGREVINAHAS